MTDTAPDPTTLITDEMVEKTARAMCDEDEGAPGYYDNELSESWREAWRAKARTVLSAIIPDIVKAEREGCALAACLHSQYPLIDIFDRGYDKGSKDAASRIRARGAL